MLFKLLPYIGFKTFCVLGVHYHLLKDQAISAKNVRKGRVCEEKGVCDGQKQRREKERRKQEVGGGKEGAGGGGDEYDQNTLHNGLKN